MQGNACFMLRKRILISTRKYPGNLSFFLRINRSTLHAPLVRNQFAVEKRGVPSVEKSNFPYSWTNRGESLRGESNEGQGREGCEEEKRNGARRAEKK